MINKKGTKMKKKHIIIAAIIIISVIIPSNVSKIIAIYKLHNLCMRNEFNLEYKDVKFSIKSSIEGEKEKQQ